MIFTVLLSARLPSRWLLCAALAWLPLPADVGSYRADLAAGRLPPIELSLLDGHLAFERALRDVFSHAPPGGGDLARALLSTSPMALPRSFSDGREPTGWDLAQRRAQAELAARRPELAELLAQVSELLSPDVWRVAEGTQRLQQLCREAIDEPAVAALVYQTADRLAPFPQYHADMQSVLAAADARLEGLASASLPRHEVELARLRLSASGDGHAATEADLASWEAAEASAPTPWQAALVQLAGLVQRARQGQAEQRAEGRAGLAAYLAQVPFDDLAARAGEQLVQRWLANGDLGRALDWCDLLARQEVGDERLAALRLILVRDGRSLLAAQQQAVLDELAESLLDQADAAYGPAMQWAAATLAEEREQPGRAHELLLDAAAISLTGVDPAAPPKARSEWWLPLGEPVVAQLRPLEYSRAACWELADQAWDAGRWQEVLLYGVFPAPAQGCGNVILEARRHALRRRAAAFDGLGRRSEALALREQLLQSAGWSDITPALIELVDQALLQGQADGLTDWLERTDATADGRLEKAARYFEFAQTLSEGRAVEAKRLAAGIRGQWPGDELLIERVDQRFERDR